MRVYVTQKPKLIKWLLWTLVFQLYTRLVRSTIYLFFHPLWERSREFAMELDGGREKENACTLRWKIMYIITGTTCFRGSRIFFFFLFFLKSWSQLGFKNNRYIGVSKNQISVVISFEVSFVIPFSCSLSRL